MLGIGIVEGFFGPEWSWEARHHFCENLRSYGGEFYIYAPKRDSYLRKNWTEKHPTEMWSKLKRLSEKCRQQNVAFGVGLSPFEIHHHWNQQTKDTLCDKIKTLEELDFSYLGLFFDDMKGAPDLADKQIEVVDFVRSVTNKTILFCPTYYSDDPILDKVFGQRSADYLEKIGGLAPEIQILWTGNKVISKSISADELETVAKVLKRRPLVWDNYFANDGPKQCKFLKLKALEGRTNAALQSSAGWAFNLMNQPRLSEIVLTSSIQVLKKGVDPAKSLEQELEKIPDYPIFKDHILKFVEAGLDGIDDSEKAKIAESLGPLGASGEIRDWLNREYIVGAECLTD